jgi:hypothetical protein
MFWLPTGTYYRNFGKLENFIFLNEAKLGAFQCKCGILSDMLCLPYNARDSHNHWLGNKFGVKG